MRTELADTQEYESCQQRDVDVDMDENKEELIFIPSAASGSAGWYEPKFMCPTGRCQLLRHRVSNGGRRRRGAHDNLHPKMLQFEARRKKGTSVEKNKQWKILVADIRSPGTSSAGLGMRGFEHKMWNLLRSRPCLRSAYWRTATELKLGNIWTDESPYKEELALLRKGDSLDLPGLMVRRAIRTWTRARTNGGEPDVCRREESA